MKKAIVMLMMLMVSASVFANKIVVDQPTNDTYAQQKELSITDVMNNFSKLQTAAHQLWELAIVDASDEEYTKLSARTERLTIAETKFLNYAERYIKVKRGELKPNAFTTDKYLRYYNNFLYEYKKFVKVANEIVEN